MDFVMMTLLVFYLTVMHTHPDLLSQRSLLDK